MGRAKGIVDVHVAQGSELRSKLIIIFFFTRMETKIFEEKNVPRLQLAHEIFHFWAYAVRRKNDIFSQETSETFGHRREA